MKKNKSLFIVNILTLGGLLYTLLNTIGLIVALCYDYSLKTTAIYLLLANLCYTLYWGIIGLLYSSKEKKSNNRR